MPQVFQTRLSRLLVLVVAMVVLLCTAALSAEYIENQATATYVDPPTGLERTAYSNTVRTEIIRVHTFTLAAEAVEISH